jgi:dihydrolipoamide dehydrogenase
MQFGVSIAGARADIPAMFARKDDIVAKLRAGVERVLAKRKVVVRRGRALLSEPGVVEIDGAEKPGAIEARRVIVATGSTPVIPAAFPHDGKLVVTSTEALSRADLPASVLIVGAGAIGCEFAEFYASLGLSVSLVEMLPEILPGEDPSAARLLRTLLGRRGVDVRTGVRVEEMSTRPGCVVATLSHGPAVEAGFALLAIGRRPALDGWGGEKLGFTTVGGAVRVNERMETSVAGVYAIGDLVGGWLLAHVASREGIVAATNAAGREAVMSYRAVPRCTYTRPEVASVGISEEGARKEGIELRVGRFPFTASGKALAAREPHGFVKVLTGAHDGKVVGGVIVGPRASELIHELALAVEVGLDAAVVANMIHAHPTLAEAVMEAGEAIEGLSIHSF